MTIIATESPATGTSGYRDAVSSASDDDRRYAGDITERLIEVVKAFAAIKHRMHGASAAGGPRSRAAAPAGPHRPDAGQ